MAAPYSSDDFITPLPSIYKPMLCGDAPEPKGEGWLIQPKLDGWRMICRIERDSVDFLTRSGALHAGITVPYISEELRANFAPGTLLDGELLGPTCGHVGSVMNAHGVHKPTPSLPALSFIAFDLIRIGGGREVWDPTTSRIRASVLTDVRAHPVEDRVLSLQAYFDERGPLEHVQMCPTDDASPEAHDAFITLGLEGSVFKRKGTGYASGQRSPNWLKLKAEHTCDAIVTGFKPGQGSFAGMAGAIEFDLIDNGVHSRCSGMDIKTRRHMTDHPDKWIGQRIEIKHNGLMKSGKPRHPQFVRLRDDL